MSDPYEVLKDEKVALIATFDDNGNIRSVIDRRAEGCDAVTVVDEELRTKPIPVDSFVTGEPLSLTLHKIEPFQILVYEPLGAGSRGRKKLLVHAYGNPIPHP